MVPLIMTLQNPSLVLVQPRKTRPFITERLLMGRKETNQTNKQMTLQGSYWADQMDSHNEVIMTSLQGQ